MHAVFCQTPVLHDAFCVFVFVEISVEQSHWVCFSIITIIFYFFCHRHRWLLLRHFPLFEPLLCHQGATPLHFIPIP